MHLTAIMHKTTLGNQNKISNKQIATDTCILFFVLIQERIAWSHEKLLENNSIGLYSLDLWIM